MPPSASKTYTTDYNGKNDKKVFIAQTGKKEFGSGGKTQIVVIDNITKKDFNETTQRLTKN